MGGHGRTACPPPPGARQPHQGPELTAPHQAQAENDFLNSTDTLTARRAASDGHHRRPPPSMDADQRDDLGGRDPPRG